MSSEQIFSDIKTPDFVLDEMSRLLHQDVHRVEEHAASGPAEHDELFLLMHETQEEYEAAQRAALGIGRSRFDVDPYATTSIYNIPNHSVNTDQYASSSQQDVGTGNFNNPFGQPLGDWAYSAIGVEQNFTNAYAESIEYMPYFDPFSTLNEKGSADEGTSWVHAQDGSEIGQSSTLDDVHDACTKNNGNVGLAAEIEGDAAYTRHRAHDFVADEELGLNDADKEDVIVPLGSNNVAYGSKPCEGDERDAPATSLFDLPVVTSENEGVIGGSFHFEFQFALPGTAEGDRAVGSSDIARNLRSSAVNDERTSTVSGLNETGSDNAKDVAQGAGTNDQSDNKENAAANATCSGDAHRDSAEATVPLESSSVGNIRTSKKQSGASTSHVEKNAAVAKADVDELKTAPVLSAGSDTAQSIIASASGTSGKTNAVKRKATTTVDVSSVDPNVKVKSAGPSKAKQPARKKLRLAKNEVAAAKSSGILTCDECLKSNAHGDVPTFNRRADLNRHLRTVHEGLEQITCDHAACIGKTFSKRSALNRHKLNFGH